MKVITASITITGDSRAPTPIYSAIVTLDETGSNCRDIYTGARALECLSELVAALREEGYASFATYRNGVRER